MANNAEESWIARNREWLKSFVRVIFGIVWLVDALLKFQPGVIESFPDMIKEAGEGQPAWLHPWFSFWYNLTFVDPTPFVYTTGLLEMALGIALVIGFMRKISYIGGMILSMLIWSIPEGFGGQYGPSSTDIGTGIIYSFVFLLLLIINATYGRSKYSVDAVIERYEPSWSKLAECRTKT